MFWLLVCRAHHPGLGGLKTLATTIVLSLRVCDVGGTQQGPLTSAPRGISGRVGGCWKISQGASVSLSLHGLHVAAPGQKAASSSPAFLHGGSGPSPTIEESEGRCTAFSDSACLLFAQQVTKANPGAREGT